MGDPARLYSWEPFKPGNVITLRHGANSERTISPVAEAFAAALLELRPDLERYPWAVSAWAWAEARSAVIRTELDRRGLDDVEARAGLLKELRADERRAAEERRALGLDPSAHARLAKDMADAGLTVDELERRRAEQLEEGRRLRLAAEPAHATIEVAARVPAVSRDGESAVVHADGVPGA